jgi:hypothetical protein
VAGKAVFPVVVSCQELASGAAGSLGTICKSQIHFFGRRRLEENRNDRQTAFPDRSSDQGY